VRITCGDDLLVLCMCCWKYCERVSARAREEREGVYFIHTVLVTPTDQLNLICVVCHTLIRVVICRYLFEYGLIRQFWLALEHCQTNFAGFIHARSESWLRGIRGSAHMSILFSNFIGEGGRNSSTIEHRYTKHLTLQFQKAVFAYYSCLDADWPSSFKCCCSPPDRGGPAHIAYDAACTCDVFFSHRDPDFIRKYNLLVDTFHGLGNSSNKGHESCSPCAGVGSWTAHTNQNHSWNEHQNRKTKRLSLLSVGVNQVVFMVLSIMHLKLANDQRRADLQLRIHQGLMEPPQSISPMFVCDGVCVAPLAKATYIHRPWLEARTFTDWRTRNPNDLSFRVMIRDPKHKKALQSLLKLDTTKQDYRAVIWTQEHSALLDHVRAERSEILWVLRFEDGNSPHDELGIVDGFTGSVRLSSEVVQLRDLFVHWSDRNHELCAVRPETAKALQPFMYKLDEDGSAIGDPPEYKDADWEAMGRDAPKALREFMDYAETQRVDPNMNVLPSKAVAILTRMLALSLCGLQSIGHHVLPVPSKREDVHLKCPSRVECTELGLEACGLEWQNLGETKPVVGRDMESETYQEGIYMMSADIEQVQSALPVIASPPHAASSITMGKLIAFLRRQPSLNEKDWNGLGITGLCIGDFIKAGTSYYSPKFDMQPKFPTLNHLSSRDCPYLTAEYFPNNPLNPDYVSKRFRFDELKDGQASNIRIRSADQVCNKKVFIGVKKFKAGLFTVYCLCCGMLLGFSVMDVAEGPRTLYDVFDPRLGFIATGWQPDDDHICYGTALSSFRLDADVEDAELNVSHRYPPLELESSEEHDSLPEDLNASDEENSDDDNM